MPYDFNLKNFLPLRKCAKFTGNEIRLHTADHNP